MSSVLWKCVGLGLERLATDLVRSTGPKIAEYIFGESSKSEKPLSNRVSLEEAEAFIAKAESSIDYSTDLGGKSVLSCFNRLEDLAGVSRSTEEDLIRHGIIAAPVKGPQEFTEHNDYTTRYNNCTDYSNYNSYNDYARSNKKHLLLE